MPHRSWTHHCPALGNRWVGTGTPRCCFCGGTGDYDGWALSRIEAMAREQWQTGLKLAGAHRAYADDLFHGSTAVCAGCHGKGMVDINSGEAYHGCGPCRGTGRILLWTEVEFDAARSRVLERYPDAAVDWWRKQPGGRDAYISSNVVSPKRYEHPARRARPRTEQD